MRDEDLRIEQVDSEKELVESGTREASCESDLMCWVKHWSSVRCRYINSGDGSAWGAHHTCNVDTGGFKPRILYHSFGGIDE